jgi:hypothetical protein
LGDVLVYVMALNMLPTMKSLSDSVLGEPVE